MKGGYALIDCTGLDLGNLGTVSGLYAKAKAAVESGKRVVLHGVVNGEQAFGDMPGFGGVESESSVFISFFPVTIHINSSDEVSM